MPEVVAICAEAGYSRANFINVEVAKHSGTSEQTVTLWRNRFLRGGMGGLADLPRSGRPEHIKAAIKGRILSEAVRPPLTLGRWSTRSMSKHLGVSNATVQRVWSTNHIKPHRTRIFKLSCDEQFEAKFWDVIGVYLNPPDNARWCSAAMKKLSVRRCSGANPVCR